MMNTDSIEFSAEIGVLSSLAHTERDLAQGVTRWILSNFRSDVATAVQHTPFTPALLCAIACREAGAFWLPLTPNRPAAEILGLCVYDASGDVPGAPRTAFPVNTSAFRLAYGEDFTNLLIQETNKARAARGLSEAAMVYKGYGIFQYDLQHVRTDESFFRARQWHSFAECVSRAVAELKKKYDVTHDIQDAVRAYNGSGPRAEQYARDVMRILPYCEEAAGAIQGAPPLMTAQVRHRELDPALSQLPAAVAPSEDDPAAPSPGEISETADLASAITFANTGSGNIIDDTDFFSALRSLAPAASPRLPLDLAKAQAFLSACVNAHPRVTYGLGAKAPFLAAVPGRDFTKIDCSGFIRQLIRLSTTPMVGFPDGSVVQHDWIRARGFEKGTIEDGFKHDDLVRIAFLRPQDTASRIGHVLLVHAGVSMESHGGTGPDSRPWTGTGWQAKTFVYVLAKL